METYKAYFYDNKTHKLFVMQIQASCSIDATWKAKDFERDSCGRYEFYDWHEDCYGF